MGKSKIDFISDLLASKRLDSSMKQRFFELAAKEIKDFKCDDAKIWEEIHKLKADFQKTLINKTVELPLNTISKNEVKKSNLKTNVTRISNPINTSKHLKKFRTGDKLKWIVHVQPNNLGSAFNYSQVTAEAIKEFKSIEYELPEKVSLIISVFLKPQKTHKFYYLDKQYETWWCNKIIDWCNVNPGIHPDLNPEISSTIIEPFKKSIEIRNGEDLIEVIRHKLLKTLGQALFDQLAIDFSGVTRATRFFTGVDQLAYGITALFNPIIKNIDASNKVKISTRIEEYNNQYVTILEIRHLLSRPGKEYSPNLLSGDFDTAKKVLETLCDWSIVANFTNGNYLISMVDSTGLVKDKLIENQTEDFTHKLIFY